MKHLINFNSFLNENKSYKNEFDSLLVKITNLINYTGISFLNEDIISKSKIDGVRISCEIKDDLIKISYQLSNRNDNNYKITEILNEFDLKWDFSYDGREFSLYVIDRNTLRINDKSYEKSNETDEFFNGLKDIIYKCSGVPENNFLYFKDLENLLKNSINKYGIRKINNKTIDTHSNLARSMMEHRCYIKYTTDEFVVSFPYENEIYNSIGEKNLKKFFFRTHDSDDGIYFGIFKDSTIKSQNLFRFRESSNKYTNYDEFLNFVKTMSEFVENKGMSEWEFDQDKALSTLKKL